MKQNPRLRARMARRNIVSEARMAVPFLASWPNPEVSEKTQRRKFSAEGKEPILEDVEPGAARGL